MSDIAISVENLGKMYRIGGKQQPYKRFTESLMDTMTAPIRRLRTIGQPAPEAETLWALKDVSFEVKQGEVVGIIGRNGAGKSTLLKILSRITEPTEGEVRIHGRVGSLLEVGTGFHPELTGRENIYLNGTILGMKRAEIDRKFDEMVEFSGVEKFLDTPVKRYSSGMYVRLAFAVAAHLEPEVLVVDEVLAVGDVAFQQKCLGKMSEVASGGRTILFVSHNMSAVASLCPTTYWIDSGKVARWGNTGLILDAYVKSTHMDGGNLRLKDRRDRTGNGQLRAVEVNLEDGVGQSVQYIQSGQTVRFAINYQSHSSQPITEAKANIIISNSQDQRLFCCISDVVQSQLTNLPENGRLICTVDKLPLIPGRYDLHLIVEANKQLADKILSVASFQVVEGDFFGTNLLPPDTGGNFLTNYHWQVEEL